MVPRSRTIEPFEVSVLGDGNPVHRLGGVVPGGDAEVERSGLQTADAENPLRIRSRQHGAIGHRQAGVRQAQSPFFQSRIRDRFSVGPEDPAGEAASRLHLEPEGLPGGGLHAGHLQRRIAGVLDPQVDLRACGQAGETKVSAGVRLRGGLAGFRLVRHFQRKVCWAEPDARRRDGHSLRVGHPALDQGSCG